MRAASAKQTMGWIACVVAVVGLPLAFGCSPGLGRLAVADAGAGSDGGPVARDAGLGPPSDAALDAPAPLGSRTETAGDELSCGDFLDDTDSDGADCSDHDCATSHICCVESITADCCPAPSSVPRSLDFIASSCSASTPAAMCASGVIGFGTSASTFIRDVDDAVCGDATGGMAPQGSDRSDAGLLFDQTFDAGSTVIALEAHVGVGSAGSGSIDAVAVGLTAQTDLGSTAARVRPTVAIVVSATDQTIRAVAGDVAFDAQPLSIFPTGSCHELDVRIVTSPNGTFDASFRRHADGLGWTMLETGRPFDAAPLSRPVVYGRTTNPGLDGVHAWVRSMGVARQVCDVLAPSRSEDTVLTGTVTGTNVRSVTRLDGLAAFESDGTIYSAGVDGNGRVDPSASPTNPQLIDPLMDPTSFYGAGAFDPELARVGANVRLYFTGLSPAGVRSIGYLDFTDDLTARVTGSVPRVLFDPTAIGLAHADGATYLEAPATGPDGPTTARLLVFRGTQHDGRTDIRALRLEGPSAILGADAETIDLADTAAASGGYTRSSPLSANEALYQSATLDEAAFDRDEVSSPELVFYNDVFRIFYAGRHGARWAIGVLRSPDFQHFERASATPVLSGSGRGFDSVSVSDPDVFLEGDELYLYYSGANGVETRPGLATQEIPTP
jgi:hypothetical protein